MQRPDHRRRRSDRGDHHFGPVPQQHLQILLQPRIGAMHDQVRADRCRRFAACIRMRLQPDVDIRQPLVELFGTAAVHRRERADHAVAACGYHKVDAGDEKHRCRDQRQAEAVAKARERIDRWQCVSSRLEPLPRCASVRSRNIGTGEGQLQNRREKKNEQSALRVSGGRASRPCGRWRATPSATAFSWPGGSITYRGATDMIGRIQASSCNWALRPAPASPFSPPTAPTPGAPASPRNCRGWRSPGCIRWVRWTINCFSWKIPKRRCWWSTASRSAIAAANSPRGARV